MIGQTECRDKIFVKDVEEEYMKILRSRETDKKPHDRFPFFLNFITSLA